MEDIAPTVSVSTGIPEAIAAMKSISFSDKSLTSIARARQLANQHLMSNFPVSRICLMNFQNFPNSSVVVGLLKKNCYGTYAVFIKTSCLIEDD